MGLYNVEYFSAAMLVPLILKTSLIRKIQIYDTALNYRILHKVDRRLSQHNLKIS
jgi:hypothetical protein